MYLKLILQNFNYTFNQLLDKNLLKATKLDKSSEPYWVRTSDPLIKREVVKHSLSATQSNNS